MEDLLSVDVDKLDLFETARWIKNIRKTILANSENPNKNVLREIINWRKKLNKIEDKAKYNKAIVLCSKTNKVYVSYKDRKVDISSIMNKMLWEDVDKSKGNIFSDLLNQYKEAEIDEIEDYYAVFRELGNYRKRPVQKYVRDLIYYRKPYDFEIVEYKMKPDKKVKRKNPLSLIEDIVNDEDKFIVKTSENIGFDTLYMKFKDPKTKNIVDKKYEPYRVKDLDKDLIESNINPKTLRNKDGYFNNGNKNFEKGLFINLIFYFGLDLDCAETFLNVNGFTIKNSHILKDRIIAECLKLGLGQKLTYHILEKNNFSIKRIYDNKKRTPENKEEPTKEPF